MRAEAVVTIGTVIGQRFVIESVGARGGMGTVFRALDRTSGEIVALKTMHTSLGVAESERLVREGSILAGLKHPGIVRHVAHGNDPTGGVYVAMEWIDGLTLRERLAQRGLTIAESVDVVRRVAESLGFAHRAGLIHRDVKPSNVMLRDGDLARPVLLDFGVARGNAASDLTHTGVMLGTPHFMAPEQARGARDIDARADVFALGGVLFKCLTGRHVFEGETLMALLAKVLLEDARDVRELAPEVPDAVADVVARMLAKIPAQRPADGILAAQALGALVLDDSAVHVTRANAAHEPEMLTDTERRLVSVIVAKMPERWAPADEETLLAAAPVAAREELARELEGRGARAEVLADGSFIASVSGFGSVLDQAAIAARCALRVREALTGTAIALVTGRAVLDRHAATSGLGAASATDVFERAATFLAREVTDAVAVDDLTAGLLDGRFDVAPSDGGFVLRGEREVVAAARTFLGRSTPCVGREREVAVLRAVWDEVRRESVARVVLVTAPLGVGKSRVRWEFLRVLEESGESHSLLFARGDAVTTSAPYALLGQALRRAAGVTDGSENPFPRLRARIARAVTSDAEEVAELLGEIAQTPNPEPSMKLRAARSEPALMAERVAWAWERFVAGESSVAAPLLLVLEDLHWGDALTVALVDRALARLDDTPWLVLALARPEIHTTFPGLWADRAVQPLPLAALSKKSAERLVRDALGVNAPVAVIERIALQGAGNALYLEELVRAEADGRGSSSSLLAMVQSRIEALDAEERRVLRAASIFGQTFWSGGLEALLHGASPKLIDDVLRSLERKELVARRGEGRFLQATELLFRHALVRDAAYEMLTSADARRGHRLAAAWLEGAGERDSFVLAGHYERSDLPARALPWLVRAAEQALRANAFADVQRVADRALAIGASGAVKGEILALRAEAYRWSADTGLSADAASAALALLPRGSSRWLEAVRTAGHTASFGGLRETLPLIADDILHVPIGDDAQRAYVIAAAQVAMAAILSGMREVGFRILERVESLGKGTFDDDPGAMARVLQASAMRAYDSGDYEQFLRDNIAMTRCHERVGDQRSLISQRINGAFALVMLGAFEEALAIFEEARAECNRLGLVSASLIAHQNAGYALYCLGDFSAAAVIQREVVALAVGRSAPRISTLARRCLGLIALEQGDATLAANEARIAVETSPDGPIRMAALAVLSDAELARGDAAAARAYASEALEALERSRGSAFVGDLSVRSAWAAVLASEGDHAGARAAIAKARVIVDERAARMTEAHRGTFLTRVPEVVRVMRLSRVDGIDGG